MSTPFSFDDNSYDLSKFYTELGGQEHERVQVRMPVWMIDSINRAGTEFTQWRDISAAVRDSVTHRLRRDLYPKVRDSRLEALIAQNLAIAELGAQQAKQTRMATAYDEAVRLLEAAKGTDELRDALEVVRLNIEKSRNNGHWHSKFKRLFDDYGGRY